MSLKKKIRIKSIHMGGSTPKKEKRKKREKKALSSIFKPNKIKNELLEKIKRHQQKKKQVSQTPEINDDSFADSFQNSLLYLDKVSEKQKKKKRKRTMKKGILKPSKYGNYQIPKEISKEISQEIINQNAYTPPPDPPYGILKNGNKELYSSYRKRTVKNNHHAPKIKIRTPEREIPKPLFVSERQDKLKTLKDSINPDPIPKKYKKMRTLKKKLRLGKYNNKVSVLIKNRRTRKKIKNETLKLKKKSLEEIKQYLRLHNLIKIGTNAPEDLLRETFENAFLSGNIYNKSTENLLHNYINNDLT
tara:strand:- start:990 stop:1901 length:912 start_codon:yes stop_codon:yes gene_type:complete